MARILIEGFENREMHQWTTSSGSIISGGIGGQYCLNTDGLPSKTFSSTYSELYFSTYFYSSSTLVNNIFTFGGVSMGIGFLVRTADDGGGNYYLRFNNANSSTIVTGTNQVPLSTWVRIEARYLPHSTTGIIQTKVNGIDDIDYTGNTTSPGETAIYSLSANGNSRASLDNIIVDDAEWIGKRCVGGGLVPNGSVTTNWQRSGTGATSNWQAIDEQPPSTSDFVFIAAGDIIDSYSASNVTSGQIGDSITYVQVRAYCRKYGSNPPTKLQLSVKSGSTTDYSSSLNVPTSSAGSAVARWATNPDTSNPWTESEINAMEIGIQSKD